MFRSFLLVSLALACCSVHGLVPTGSHIMQHSSSALLPENNVTSVFRRLFAAVMDRSRSGLEEVFADTASGFTVGPQYYPFPNKTALVDMLFSCSWLDPVYAFYILGLPTFKSTGMYVGNAPFIGETNEAGIPTDFLYIELDHSQTRINFYLEMVPLFPMANQSTSVTAATSFLDSFASGDVQVLRNLLTDDFEFKVGFAGQDNYTAYNKSSYLSTFQEDLASRKTFIYKISSSSAVVNIALVQYAYVRTAKNGAKYGSMGQDTLRVVFVGDGDYRIQAIDGFRRIDRAV